MKEDKELTEDQMKEIMAGMPKERLEELKEYIKNLPKDEELTDEELEQTRGGVHK